MPVMFVPVMDDGVPPAPLKSTGAPAEPVVTPSAVTLPAVAAAHAIVVLVEFSIRHGAVAPTIVVVPGVIEAADAVPFAAAVIRPCASTVRLVTRVAARRDSGQWQVRRHQRPQLRLAG